MSSEVPKQQVSHCIPISVTSCCHSCPLNTAVSLLKLGMGQPTLSALGFIPVEQTPTPISKA